MKSEYICNDCWHELSQSEYEQLSELFCPECGGHIEEKTESFADTASSKYNVHKEVKHKGQTSHNTNHNSQDNIQNKNHEIEHLNKIVNELRMKGKKAVASRNQWRQRAEIAESKLSQSKSKSNDLKFKKVKQTFSKMYHPDCINGDRFEKMIKQEIFKEFWQVIESIEKNEA